MDGPSADVWGEEANGALGEPVVAMQQLLEAFGVPKDTNCCWGMGEGRGAAMLAAGFCSEPSRYGTCHVLINCDVTQEWLDTQVLTTVLEKTRKAPRRRRRRLWHFVCPDIRDSVAPLPLVEWSKDPKWAALVMTRNVNAPVVSKPTDEPAEPAEKKRSVKFADDTGGDGDGDDTASMAPVSSTTYLAVQHDNDGTGGKVMSLAPSDNMVVDVLNFLHNAAKRAGDANSGFAIVADSKSLEKEQMEEKKAKARAQEQVIAEQNERRQSKLKKRRSVDMGKDGSVTVVDPQSGEKRVIKMA